MIQTRRRFAFSMGLLLAFLTSGCGSDIVLPDEGEAANLLIFDGDDQAGQVGAALGEPIIVRVTDTRSRPVPNHDVSFSIGSGGGSVGPATVKTNTEGQASATWTLGPNPGAQLLRVQTRRGGSTSNLEVSFRATANVGTASVLAGVSGDDQTGPVNSALADSLVVRTTDALGNPVANVEVTWTVSGGGSISPVTVQTDDNGLAAAERVLGAAAGAQAARATVAGFTGSPVTFSHTAVPANPTVLVLVDGDGQIGPGGFALAESLVVRLEDDNGNGIGNRPISWVVSSGSGSASPTTVTTDPKGLAATSWTIPTGVGNYALSAVFSGLPAVQFTATATADVPTTLELVSGNNQSARVGTALANPLVVRVTDANDNPVANVGVTWTAQNGGSVSESNTATDANGLAQVTRTLGILPVVYTTTAEVAGLDGSPITFTSTGQVGPPVRLVIVTQPGSPVASGGIIDPAPSIQVVDEQDNPVTQAGIVVDAAITSGQAGASLGVNDQRLTNANGRANFANLTISGPPDNDYQLTFTASVGGVDLTPVTSADITVTAGNATRIVILQQPSTSLQSGDEFGQQPAVQVQDASGNPINGNRTIEVELGQGDGDGDLIGDVTATTGAGSTATFSDLGIAGESGSYTLIFRSGTLTPAESGVITLVNNPPTADADAYPTDEDEVLNVDAGSGVLVGDSDPDGDGLTAVNVVQPPNGSVTMQATGAFTYTPAPDFNGTDQFTYQASDGRGNVSAAATVTITVNEVNDPPVFDEGADITGSALDLLSGFDQQWATGISAGPPDENQSVEFIVTLDDETADASAFAQQPEVDADGTLTFATSLLSVLDPRTVPVTVVAQDLEGEVSDPQGFTITITP